jgi:hypothetical protein
MRCGVIWPRRPDLLMLHDTAGVTGLAEDYVRRAY